MVGRVARGVEDDGEAEAVGADQDAASRTDEGRHDGVDGLAQSVDVVHVERREQGVVVGESESDDRRLLAGE